MSHFKCNYCPCVWHFARRTDVRKLENVLQFRCLKYIYNHFTSNYGELRKRSERPAIYAQGLWAIRIEVYKAYFSTLVLNIYI